MKTIKLKNKIIIGTILFVLFPITSCSFSHNKIITSDSIDYIEQEVEKFIKQYEFKNYISLYNCVNVYMTDIYWTHDFSQTVYDGPGYLLNIDNLEDNDSSSIISNCQFSESHSFYGPYTLITGHWYKKYQFSLKEYLSDGSSLYTVKMHISTNDKWAHALHYDAYSEEDLSWWLVDSQDYLIKNLTIHWTGDGNL